ncbi:MAG: glycogen debranching N-terminal domain-containing protein [Candidatus Sulfotelmatobacter sp.]
MRATRGPDNISQAVVIKDEEVFFLCDRSGNVPVGNQQGFGLYYHDCRFLRGYELSIGGMPLNSLASTSEHGFMSEFVLTNPDLQQPDESPLPKQSIGIHWQRIINSAELSLKDIITCTNYKHSPLQFVLSFHFAAGFEDVFQIRGLQPEKIGRRGKPTWQSGSLFFQYNGADGLYRSLRISLAPKTSRIRRDGVDLELSLAPNENKQVRISLAISESNKKKQPAALRSSKPDANRLTRDLHQDIDDWVKKHCEVKSNSPLLNDVFQRSILDLRILRTSLDDHEYFSAGLPWYGALFGRDSAISSLQSLAFEPRIAEHTLRLLAKFQGAEVNEWRDEQPGKILHEYRVGELAHLNEIPQTPYYGSVDSTPLFLILVAQHAKWTGDLTLFHELKRPIESAFNWIRKYGDESGNGYLEYKSKSKKGLGNQGWKDSGDAIVNSDGSLALPPIALVEVQGYVYLAKMTVAELYDRAGDRSAAEGLRDEARQLRTHFERDFWLKEKGIYALALQAGKNPAAVVSSNAGQALWSGMVDAARAKRTVEQLMSRETFSGWGVRTLSSAESRYNPVGYHLGTVWPHDNSIIAAGFRKYGFDDAACRIFAGIVEASKHFERRRLPEVFAGFSRDEFPIPVRYPIACHPQAWAAGTMPFMLESLLGLVPNAFENHLQIVRPVLPEFVHSLELRRLRIGKATVDLSFNRKSDGSLAADVIKVDGKLDVEFSSESNRAAA